MVNLIYVEPGRVDELFREASTSILTGISIALRDAIGIAARREQRARENTSNAQTTAREVVTLDSFGIPVDEVRWREDVDLSARTIVDGQFVETTIALLRRPDRNTLLNEIAMIGAVVRSDTLANLTSFIDQVIANEIPNLKVPQNRDRLAAARSVIVPAVSEETREWAEAGRQLLDVYDRSVMAVEDVLLETAQGLGITAGRQPLDSEAIIRLVAETEEQRLEEARRAIEAALRQA